MYNMSMLNQLRVLAGLEPVMESAKKDKVKGPPKKYIATYDGKTLEVMAADESEAKQKAVDVKGLSVPMTQWGKVSIKLAESVDATTDTGNCSECGHSLVAPLARNAEGELGVVPGLVCDICDAVDSYVDSDEYVHMTHHGEQYQDEIQKMRDTQMAVPTRGEDRPGTGYESRSDDTGMRDGRRFESTEVLGTVITEEKKEDKVATDEAPAENAPAKEEVAKVKVPADITSAISTRITELKAAIEQFDKKDFNDKSVKQNAIDALEQIAADLKLEDGIAKAGTFYGTLMSPIQDMFPPKVIKFIHAAPKAVKEAYEEYADSPGWAFAEKARRQQHADTAAWNAMPREERDAIVAKRNAETAEYHKAQGAKRLEQLEQEKRGPSDTEKLRSEYMAAEMKLMRAGLAPKQLIGNYPNGPQDANAIADLRQRIADAMAQIS